MNNKKILEVIDILKINHFLNARKITHKYIHSKLKSLSKKLKTKKNFQINSKELTFINKKLSNFNITIT